MSYSYKLLSVVPKYAPKLETWPRDMKAWFQNMKAWFRNMIAWFRNIKYCCRWTLWHIKLCFWFEWFSPSNIQ